MPSKGLFSPFKAIGYVTDGKPFVVNAMNSENFIYTIIGKSFQIFRFDKLRVCLVSSPAPGNISSLQVHDDLAYASVDNDIYIYKRKDIVNKINIHDSKILGLLLIGFVLISYDVNNHLKIYDLKNRDLLGDIILLQSSTISSICHPATYINKVIIGYDNACDVVGVGYHNGTIQLLNMKLDIVLFSFQQDNQCIVTSLSFRTDIGAEKFPYMVSGSSDGRVHIWNLGKVSTSDDDTNQNSAEVKPEKLIHQLENTINNGHIGYISNVHFLYGEPILITNSIDNSLKVWIFDMPNSNLPRLLRSREGHQGPSLKLRYYGGITAVSMRHMNDGSNSCLLSAGSDNTFRYFNTQIEHRNREISQVNILKKLDSNVQSLFLVGYKDGGYVAICGSDRVIRVYDMFTQKLIRRFSNGHSREITDICFSVNGKRVLTSSLDCTIRVYDTSTGRCISWLLFDSAVLSMAISLSGEYLCISQVDRDGIGMYVDRSLYETFHISKEPTNPIIVDSSNVHVDDNTKIFHDEESEEIDIDSDIEDNKSVSSNDSIIDNSKLKHKETTNQRAAGLITMSAIPKAYWTTLFHLEEIKFRNKLKEYDAEPKQTPFFLPTLVRDGVTPSFPTPEEYSKMVPKNESNKKVDNDDNNDNFKVDDLKSAWNDEPDNDNTWDDINVVSEDEDNETKHFSSKIIKGRSSLPRCQLVAHILTEYPNCLSNDYSTSYPHKDSGLDRPILSYLKSIPPSKIDIEMRSLCQHDNDDEGSVDVIFMNASKISDNEKSKSIRPFCVRANNSYTGLLQNYPSYSSMVLAAANYGNTSEKFATISSSTSLSSRQFVYAIQQLACQIFHKEIENQTGATIDVLPDKQKSASIRLAVELLLHKKIIPIAIKQGNLL
eukprot:gene17969-23600_t